MEKQFTNLQLKNKINDIHTDNNIIISDELKIIISQSSRTQYKTLIKIYDELINSIKLKLKEETPKQIEIQTSTEDDLSKELIEVKTDNYKLKQIISDYKYKILCYKKEMKKLNHKELKEYISSSSEDDEKQNRIKYNQLSEFSSFNLIQELSKLERHKLKQIYNRYFSNKLNRKLNITN